MNLDELVLKNGMPLEECQFMRNPSSSSSSSSHPIFMGDVNLNVSPTLTKKTGDQVWKEMFHQQEEHANKQSLVVHGQPLMNLGENQDGLVIAPRPLMAIDPTVPMNQPSNWLQFQTGDFSVHQQQQELTHVPMPAFVEANFQVSEACFDTENQLALPLVTMQSMVEPTDSEYAQVGVDQSKLPLPEDCVMEKTIERRQKRMIKNRESAARSRARKQAYTNQLEHEIFQLRKTNNWLKKQKEAEMFLSSIPASARRYQLRRTGSASF